MPEATVFPHLDVVVDAGETIEKWHCQIDRLKGAPDEVDQGKGRRQQQYQKAGCGQQKGKALLAGMRIALPAGHGRQPLTILSIFLWASASASAGVSCPTKADWMAVAMVSPTAGH